VRDQYYTPAGELKNPDDATAVRGEIRIWEIMRALLERYRYNSGDGFSW